MIYCHIWFQTKLKKYMLVDMIDGRIHELFKQIAEEKGIQLIASGSLPDHAHLLINNFWERKYGVKEVAMAGLQTTANYIRNQKKDLHVV